ncbi:response regulator [Desulfuromonas acetoxidans]|uniref:Response regulator receiver protein n=1 Tax=Desulfuromonas acetoxidans (strain DSM 684 / 11070) TaxID=281689 RepID=Q1JYU6_DESA6|nr:response regulator [Desulfuromonas acetoxidans]EAT15319.1 response regulator receiver protein [Desulfuromonas acetoxidans DSM 684]MBF0644918.1 response regulator [Desulfuromonas acetoxidans]NVD25435.1 response regulator [Desulfuromonas acetoxidans]NVE17464.1 response regulator [Desulfuromonas acetoxidans]
MKQILIVDDEKKFLLSLTEGLKSRLNDVKVFTAHNGKEALEVLKFTTVDLLVTDLKMPIMDGFELLAIMSTHFASTPVIVMTAFGTPHIEKHIRQFGSVQYLEKPTELAVMANKIRQTLADKAQGFIQGITLPTFAQLMELEKKSCTLRIKQGDKIGQLYFYQGDLVDATCNGQNGDEAAYAIFSWKDVVIEMQPADRQRHRCITTKLSHILLDALRQEDEKQTPQKEQTNDSVALDPCGPQPDTIPGNQPDSNTPTKEINIMTVQEKLKEFNQVDGFAGVGVFTPSGESLALLTSEAKGNMKEVGVLANNLLMTAQKATMEMGIGLGQLVHIESEHAHIFACCFNEGSDPLKSQPGKAHIHLVLVLTSDSGVGMAKLKIEKLTKVIAEDFRI